MSRIGQRKCPRHSTDLEQRVYDTPYKCNGCKMEGIDLGYKCKKCDYVLHPQCANPKQHIRPAYLSHHVFQFMPYPITQAPQRYCDACGMKVLGFVYHCSGSSLGYDLHPCCASLQRTLEIDDNKLVIDTEMKLSNCHGCNSEFVKDCKGKNDGIPGYCYVYEDDTDHGYHVYCVVNMAVEELKRESKGWALSKNKSIYSGGSDVCYTVLTAMVNYVIAILSHDPIAVTRLVVNDALQIAQFLSKKW